MADTLKSDMFVLERPLHFKKSLAEERSFLAILKKNECQIMGFLLRNRWIDGRNSPSGLLLLRVKKLISDVE